MFWEKKDKKPQPLHEPYQDKKYVQDYDWIDYYRPKRKKTSYGWGDYPDRQSSRSRTFYSIVAALSILALLLVVKQTDHPVGEGMREGLKYVLTTDWNVRPAMEKAVKFGLQVAGIDSPLDSGMPQEGVETMGKTTPAERMLIPVSGKVVREYGWSLDSLDDMERFHPGIDISAGPGVPVKSAMAGKVKKIGTDSQYGKYILLDHGDGIYTLYAGVGNVKVTVGQEVKAGENIAEVARDGDIKGSGLHFELREKGVLTDPLNRIDFPPVN